MKKLIAWFSVVSFVMVYAGFDMNAYSQPQNPEEDKVVEKIEAEVVAEELAARSDGRYIRGAEEPVLKSGEVALPIIDEESGEVLGFVVADKDKLVAVLNDVGLTEVANALAAMEAGETAGEVVEAGLSRGTMTWIGIGAAAVLGLALAGGGGGGGGGGGTTTPPAH